MLTRELKRNQLIYTEYSGIERREKQNREEGEMARESREGGENKKLRIKREPIDEKVIFWPDDKGVGDGEFDVHCDPLGSPGTPLV